MRGHSISIGSTALHRFRPSALEGQAWSRLFAGSCDRRRSVEARGCQPDQGEGHIHVRVERQDDAERGEKVDLAVFFIQPMTPEPVASTNDVKKLADLVVRMVSSRIRCCPPIALASGELRDCRDNCSSLHGAIVGVRG